MHCPEARNEEDPLDHQRATEQGTGVDGEDGDEREHRRAQGVAEQHVALRDSLGAGHQDEVVLERGDEVGAQESLVDGDAPGWRW